MSQAYNALAEAKRLLRTVRAGTLATRDDTGAPFASLVTVATLVGAEPVLLLSGLAAHTTHLTADARCALLLAESGKGDPLAHPRLTVAGEARRLVEPAASETARARFLARHPKAVLYADFTDFGLWRIDIVTAHLNGGFARAARFKGADLLVDSADLAVNERRAVAHLNADHRDALALYGAVLADRGPGVWTASGVDPDGIDLICGDRVARVLFDAPVRDGSSLRSALVRLAEHARALPVATARPDEEKE